jgi:PAS domain S-box-containing protein
MSPSAGQIALERILVDPPDLVLADVMMPRLDGFSLLKRLRADERTRPLPFIMLSARAGEEPDDHESYCKKFLAAAAAGRRFRAECRVRRGDGEWRWVDSWAVPRSSESERRSGMVGCNVDVTERVQAEERIRELGAIVEFSEDAILGKTLDGIITSWNKGAERIYGFAAHEAVGKSVSICFHRAANTKCSKSFERLPPVNPLIHMKRCIEEKMGKKFICS